jgi:plasmid stability protein
MKQNMAKSKRLNVNLPEGIHDDLRELADRSGRSMTDIVRTGLSLVHVAMDAAQSRNTLAVADSNGKLIRQIIVAI